MDNNEYINLKHSRVLKASVFLGIKLLRVF